MSLFICGRKHLGSVLCKKFNALTLNRVQNKSEIPIKWVQPKPVPIFEASQSGDLTMETIIDWDKVPLQFEKSKEYQTADDIVKKLYTFRFLGRKFATKRIQQELVNKVKTHRFDFSSYEARIAAKTAIIRNFAPIVLQCPSNKPLKVYVKTRIEKRKKLLRYLRCSDYRRFEWLLEKLDLFYKHNPVYKKLSREDSIRKLTDRYCEEYKLKKLESYRQLLHEEKLAFLKEKVETLEWARKEELECDMTTPTVTEQDIEDAKKQLQEYIANIPVKEIVDDSKQDIAL